MDEMTDATAPAEAGSDSELMGRVREGETEGLAPLFERHHRRLYNYFLRLAGSRSVAEDLVQEVFVRMLRYRQTFRSGAEFVPWMYALARNVANDHWRGRPRELEMTEETPEPVAAEAHPLAGLEVAESQRRLAAALARLEPAKRELLLMARSGELRYEAIGALLGVSAGAVKVRVHRATKELRTAWEAVGEVGA
jgi:RNA polymerase sigma factor (sigma-70 family)